MVDGLQDEASGGGGTRANAPLLAVEGLTVSAGGSVVVRDLSLALGTGERVALVGPSGSGKTTVLRALAGLEDPVAGTVRLEGRRPEAWGWTAYRLRVAYVSQQPAFVDATVEAVLARPFGFRAATTIFPEQRARALLERSGLPEAVWGQRARTLSVGQQQRVALVRALLVEPTCLLLDEPTSGLDAAAVGAVEELLREATGELGAAALIVSHDRDLAARLCHRVVDLPGPRAGA